MALPIHSIQLSFPLSVVHPPALFLRGLAGVCNQSWDAAGISDPHERWDLSPTSSHVESAKKTKTILIFLKQSARCVLLLKAGCSGTPAVNLHKLFTF